MQNISATLKPHYFSFATGFALLLLLTLLNFSSTGIVRGGDEDDGSGFGGTGRMAAPGSESGFGGTGFKPFLGVNESNELQIMRSPAQQDTAITESLDLVIAPRIPVSKAPVEQLVAVTTESFITRDSSAINITEAIQYSVDANAIYFQRLQRQIVASNVVDTAGIDLSVSPELANSIANAGDLITEQAPYSGHIDEVIQDRLTWNAVAKFLSQNIDRNAAIPSSELMNNLPGVGVETDAAARLARPDRIQRPELPPVQRFRPIQRASILPPRVRPLRL